MFEQLAPRGRAAHGLRHLRRPDEPQVSGDHRGGGPVEMLLAGTTGPGCLPCSKACHLLCDFTANRVHMCCHSLRDSETFCIVNLEAMAIRLVRAMVVQHHAHVLVAFAGFPS